MTLLVADTVAGAMVFEPEPALQIGVPKGVYLRIVKPVLDRVLAAVLLLLTLPVLAATALVLRVTLGRGVLLKQTRIGLDGQPFTLLKFRTMRPCRRADNLTSVPVDRRMVHKSGDDPRHTPVGRRLRAWSLDELPQLINVVAGHMSLVGPRPELATVVARYEPWQHTRHVVKPGLTGLWQVSHRGDGLMHEFSHVDLDYIARVGPRLDLWILVMTLPTLLLRRGS